MVRKIASAIVVLCFVFSLAGIVSASEHNSFDLINYLENNDVNSRVELQCVLENNSVDCASIHTITGDEVFFDIDRTVTFTLSYATNGGTCASTGTISK